MRKYTLLNFLVVILFLFCYQKVQAQVVIDGNLFDWNESSRLDIAPNDTSFTFEEGDQYNPGTSNPKYNSYLNLDVSHIYTVDDTANLYIRVKMNPLADVSVTPTDTNLNGGGIVWALITLDPSYTDDTTGISWGSWTSGWDLYVQLSPRDSAAEVNGGEKFNQYVWQHTQLGNSNWEFKVADTSVGAKVAWNASNNDMEVSIPKSILQHPAFMGKIQTDSIGICIEAAEQFTPWWTDWVVNYKDQSQKPYFYGMIYNYKNNITGIEASSKLPSEYSLLQNYPNPFNPSTTISYSLPKNDFVTIKIYNGLGQEIKTLVNTMQSAGKHTINMSTKNLASGVYIYTMTAGGFTKSMKMAVQK
jgi:hypothetical protein